MAPTAAEKMNLHVPFEPKAQGWNRAPALPRGSGGAGSWLSSTGLQGLSPIPELGEAADAAAEGSEDGDNDLYHPELSWQTQPTIAQGSDTGTSDGAELGLALGARRIK